MRMRKHCRVTAPSAQRDMTVQQTLATDLTVLHNQQQTKLQFVQCCTRDTMFLHRLHCKRSSSVVLSSTFQTINSAGAAQLNNNHHASFNPCHNHHHHLHSTPAIGAQSTQLYQNSNRYYGHPYPWGPAPSNHEDITQITPDILTTIFNKKRDILAGE